MSIFSNWLTGVVGASVLASMAIAVTPDGAVKKTVKLCGGLAVILMVLIPLQKLKNINPFEGFSLPLEENFDIAQSDALKEFIEKRTGAYIVNKAQALGLEITVNVVCEAEGIYPRPYMVTVYSQYPQQAEGQLGGMIDKDMGVPASRQRFYLGG